MDSDLDEVASKGYSYYNTLLGKKNNEYVYQKDYHENVNDYQKNISQSIFTPGNTLPQYTQTIRDSFNPNYTPLLKNRAKSAAHRRRSPQKHSPEKVKNKDLHKTVKQQRGHTIKLVKRNNSNEMRETKMQKFNPLRDNAIVANPSEMAKTKFI